MKKKEKQRLLILVVVAVLIIGVIWFITRPKNEEIKGNNGGTSAGTASLAQGEFTEVKDNGTVVNTSEKLNQNKEESGFLLTNIKLEEKNGETTLYATVTNKTEKEQAAFLGKIVLLDKKGKEVGRIPVMISDMQIGEAIDIQASITERYTNAYNFRLER